MDVGWRGDKGRSGEIWGEGVDIIKYSAWNFKNTLIRSAIKDELTMSF